MEKYLFLTGKADNINKAVEGRLHSDVCLSTKVNQAIELGYQVVEMGTLEQAWNDPLWCAMVKVED